MKLVLKNECPGDLQRKLCANIMEDMKYIVAEIIDHNSTYPRYRIVIDYKAGDDECTIYSEPDSTYIASINAKSNYLYCVGIIRGYSKGLSAAGIKSTTPKNL